MDEPLPLLTALTEFILASHELPGFAELPIDVPKKGLVEVPYALGVIGESYEEAIAETQEHIAEVLEIFTE